MQPAKPFYFKWHAPSLFCFLIYLHVKESMFEIASIILNFLIWYVSCLFLCMNILVIFFGMCIPEIRICETWEYPIYKFILKIFLRMYRTYIPRCEIYVYVPINIAYIHIFWVCTHTFNVRYVVVEKYVGYAHTWKCIEYFTSRISINIPGMWLFGIIPNDNIYVLVLYLIKIQILRVLYLIKIWAYSRYPCVCATNSTKIRMHTLLITNSFSIFLMSIMYFPSMKHQTWQEIRDN